MPKSTRFNFGIYSDALESGVVDDSADLVQKISYCFWWGLQNLRFNIASYSICFIYGFLSAIFRLASHMFELYIMQLLRSKPQNEYICLGSLLRSFRFTFWVGTVCISNWKYAGRWYLVHVNALSFVAYINVPPVL